MVKLMCKKPQILNLEISDIITHVISVFSYVYKSFTLRCKLVHSI